MQWELPRPLIAAAVEGQLDAAAGSRVIVVGGAGRSGPGADARLLSLLAGRPRTRHRDARPRLVQACGSAAGVAGWQAVLLSPTMHLLAKHASTLRDYESTDVQGRYRRRRPHLGLEGVITTTGGQTAILDINAVLAARHSRTLFAETDPELIQRRIEVLVGRRGVGPTFNPRLVTYLAEAMENVREHALVAANGSVAGICLLQIKRMNLDQMPGIERQLPESSAFRGYVAGVRTRYGRRLQGLLETTVADSGTGIAATLTSDRSLYIGDPERERDVLLRAFDPAVSRKPTAGSGGGLTTMLENLHAEDGAVQVRCGRYSLFRTSVTQEGRRLDWSLPGPAGPSRSPDPRLFRKPGSHATLRRPHGVSWRTTAAPPRCRCTGTRRAATGIT